MSTPEQTDPMIVLRFMSAAHCALVCGEPMTPVLEEVFQAALVARQRMSLACESDSRWEHLRSGAREYLRTERATAQRHREAGSEEFAKKADARAAIHEIYVREIDRLLPPAPTPSPSEPDAASSPLTQRQAQMLVAAAYFGVPQEAPDDLTALLARMRAYAETGSDPVVSLSPTPPSEPGEGGTFDLDRGADAFWGSIREHLSVEACEAVEGEGVHPTDWRAAAERCIRAARGERDYRPFTTYPDMDQPPSPVPPLTLAPPSPAREPGVDGDAPPSTSEDGEADR